MPNLNRCEISGHLGKDPELRYSQAGKAYCNFSVAVSSKDRNGKEETVWFNCICFGENAETVSKLSKGQAVHCEGPVKLDTFTGKDGKERSSLKLTAFKLHPIEKRQWSEHKTSHPQKQPAKQVQSKADLPESDDDIVVPF